MSPQLTILIDWPGLCQTLAQAGLRVFLGSTLLLLLGLLLGHCWRRKGAARLVFLYQAALGGVALCLLCVGLTPHVSGPLMLTLPPATAEATGAEAPLPAPNPVPSAFAPGQQSPSSAVSPTSAEDLRDASGHSVQVQALPLKPASQAADVSLVTITDSLRPEPMPLTRMGRIYMMVVGVWLCGVVLLLGWLTLCYAGIARLCRRAAPVSDAAVQERFAALCAAQGVRTPLLLVSREARSIFLAGVWRPAVLLPADYATHLKPPMLDAVLAHEIAHLRARDGGWTLLTRLLCAVLWLQPLLWRVGAWREQASEETCDLAALTQGCSPPAYAACLMSLAERLSPSSWERVASGGSVVFRSSLGQRVQQVLHGSRCLTAAPSRQFRLLVGAGSVLLAGLLSLTVSFAQGQSDLSLVGNPRLEQKVRVAAEGVSMGDLLRLLASKTGVSLEADASTADDKLVVFGPARPLKELMADMAALFNDVWLHNRDGDKHTYRLTRTRRAREYEEALADALTLRLLAQMNAQIRALNETPEQMAQRPEDDPIRVSLSDPEHRTATGILSALTPEQRRQLVEVGQVRLPVSVLSAAQKDSIEDLFHGKRVTEANKDPNIVSGVYPPIAEIPRAQMDQHELHFDLINFAGADEARGAMRLDVAGPAGFNLVVMELRARTEALMPPHGNPYSPKSALGSAPLPDPAHVRAIKAVALPDRLKALAEETETPVMADYYRSRAIHAKITDEPPAPGTPAVEALDAFCRPLDYLWWSRGKTLLLRKRDWYDQRLYEVPDHWLDTLTQRLKRQKNLPTYADVYDLLELSTRQMVGLNESLGQIADRRLLMGLRELLTVAAASPGDKNAPLFTGVIGRDAMPQQIAVMPGLTDARQQQILSAFLQASGRRIAPNEIVSGDFGVLIQTNGSPKGLEADAASVPVAVHLYTGRGTINAGYLLALPLLVPDDRRDKTQVEIVP